MKTILVSLISEQVVPNLQFILEKQVDQHIFITTHKMKKKGFDKWLLKASKINEENITIHEISAFDYNEIFNKLKANIEPRYRYLVNITGGTKIMTLAVYDFFKDWNSEIYYLTGDNNYIKLWPDQNITPQKLESTVNLELYLQAYGFTVRHKGKPIRSFRDNEKVLDYFLNNGNKINQEVLAILREHRDKGLKNIDTLQGIQEFLDQIDFKPNTVGKLTKYEVRYLTGEWLEEYMYQLIIEKEGVREENIGMGWQLYKNTENFKAPNNEFDVLFMKDNKLHLLECKTSLYTDVVKKRTIINDTIYKSDSLRNKMGLFTKTYIITLDDLSVEKFKASLERADANGVGVKGKEQFINQTLLSDVFKSN